MDAQMGACIFRFWAGDGQTVNWNYEPLVRVRSYRPVTEWPTARDQLGRNAASPLTRSHPPAAEDLLKGPFRKHRQPFALSYEPPRSSS